MLSRKSAVELLCSDYEKLHAVESADMDALSAAERAYRKAQPRPPALIRPTKKNAADFLLIWTEGRKVHFDSLGIKREIESIINSRTKREDPAPGTILLTISETETFPPSKKEQARLSRLQRRLSLATAYEKKCNAIARRFRVDQREGKFNASSDRALKVRDKIARAPSKSRSDLTAKVKLFGLDKSLMEDPAMLESVVRDLVHLTA